MRGAAVKNFIFRSADGGRNLPRRRFVSRHPRRGGGSQRYPWPIGSVRRYAEANHIALPPGGLFIAHGIAVPILMAVGIGIAMTFLATRTRFGRYVYAIGGNREAVELAGVDARWVVMKLFMLMGLLAGIGSAVSIARLNAATNSEGTLTELLVIAAAVIGGSSLAGGVGTVAGAMLGAVLMRRCSRACCWSASIRRCRTSSLVSFWCSRY